METPLGEALRAISKPKKEKRTIRVCGCGTPLIWTFCFAYSERFCINCGIATEMFDGSENVPATRELVFKKKIVDAIWHVIYGKKGLLPNGKFGRVGCKLCKAMSDENHWQHLTPAEKEWDQIAHKYLSKFEGIFDDVPPGNGS